MFHRLINTKNPSHMFVAEIKGGFSGAGASLNIVLVLNPNISDF